MTLANEEGEPYLFYLEKGMTIALEVVSSETGELLREVNDVIYRLNDLYRQIIMITGTTVSYTHLVPLGHHRGAEHAAFRHAGGGAPHSEGAHRNVR